MVSSCHVSVSVNPRTTRTTNEIYTLLHATMSPVLYVVSSIYAIEAIDILLRYDFRTSCTGFSTLGICFCAHLLPCLSLSNYGSAIGPGNIPSLGGRLHMWVVIDIRVGKNSMSNIPLFGHHGTKRSEFDEAVFKTLEVCPNFLCITKW